ncbi:hypothetical protein Dip518_000498 [Parelusimicrobium proximum]|uniref:sulfite exporter TauE/SafE family protein n=1 Tax=Parelusimicrobium proximum TaxID=3228953 RepID=UPI003D172807
MSLLSIIILIFANFVISLLGAMFGLGGGIFIVPLLHFGFNVPLQEAVACSLVCIVASSMMSSMAKVRHGVINIRLSKMLEIPSITGAIFGALIIGAMPVNFIKILFSAIAVIMAVNMLKNPFKRMTGRKVKPYFVPVNTRGEFADVYRDSATGRSVRYEIQNVRYAVPVSLAAGLLSSLIGIGGGVVNVPLITMLCKAPVKVASATSSYKLGITACAGSLIYFAHGNVLPEFALPSVLGTMCGAYVGMNLLLRIKEIYIQFFFGLLMVFVAVKMFFSI